MGPGIAHGIRQTFIVRLPVQIQNPVGMRALVNEIDRATVLQQLQQVSAQNLQTQPWTALIHPDLLSTLQQEYKPQFNEILRPGFVPWGGYCRIELIETRLKVDSGGRSLAWSAGRLTRAGHFYFGTAA